MISRDPVVWANAIAGVLAAAVSVGLLNASQATNVNGVVQALVGAASFLLPLIAGFLARRRVTPVADPRDTDGTRLVRSGVSR